MRKRRLECAVKFNAELKRTSQRKAASLDNIYQVVLETDNPEVLDLGKLPSDTLFNIDINWEKLE